jgi:hypothetical protein
MIYEQTETAACAKPVMPAPIVTVSGEKTRFFYLKRSTKLFYFAVKFTHIFVI